MDVERRMAVSNVNTITNWVAIVFKWAEDNSYIGRSPASGLKMKQEDAPDEERDIYTLEKLTAFYIQLAGHKNLSPETHPERVWVPVSVNDSST